jgi:hypothetical protein
MTVIMPVPPKYSHLTQVLLNYFPYTDRRIRENPITLGAQLLNSVAYQMEQQDVRINREVRALNLSDMPMNIDNQGVYYATRVPLSFSLPIDSQGNLLPPATVKGQIQSGPLVTLVPYDDTLPVPTRLSKDPVLSGVPLTNPELINVTGDGTPKTYNPGVLPLPNYLTFYVQGMGPVTQTITVSITGELDPPAVWPQDIQSKNELLYISDDGYYQTDSVWSSIDAIDITGLPTGCQLICYSLGVNLPLEADKDRPFTHHSYRKVAFPRYWQLNDLLLFELYQRNRFSGPETYQTYTLPTQMVDIAVEPNTGGLFLTDGSHLYYMDRRTPMPDNLVETGLTQEPGFGLNVHYDYTHPGDTKYAYVEPIAYAGAAAITQYRYVVEDSTGAFYILLLNGDFQEYSGTNGWQNGSPKAVSFPLTVAGTYLITLEQLGSFNAKTVDVFPFPNFAAHIQGTIDTSSVVPSIQGLAFDAYDRLWLWTGQFAIPIKISYDAYIWDPSTRTIYATDKYTQLVIS